MDQFADALSHFVRAVDNSARSSGVRDFHVRPAEHMSIAVAACLCEHRDRYLHARSSYKPVVDGLFHTQVSPSGIAHAGHAGVERCLHVVDGLIEAVRKRGVEPLEGVDCGHREVHVTVEEARHECLAGHIDLGISVETRADGGDPAVFYSDFARGGGCAGAVEYLTAGEHC